MLLMMAAQDIRDNAKQIINVEDGDDRDETSKKLATFFDSVDNLTENFPWDIKLTCPMALASIESREDDDVKITRFTITGEDPMYERTCAAFAEIAFQQADIDEGHE